MTHLNILVAVPQPLRGHILSEADLARLQALGDVTLNEDGENWSAQQLAMRIKGVDALVASWGLAKLDAVVLDQADQLRIVAYGAGSVKGFVSESLFDKGILLTHGASRIADSVAEYTLLLALCGLRRPHELDRRLKAGEPWPKSRDMPFYELAGKRVGLLGMGYVGRKTAARFQALGAEVWAYDPYMPVERAQALGVHLAELDDLLQNCFVISIHLPVTEETHNLLGARELALISDGALFINTARSWTVDQDALLAELRTGRLWAAIDVFDTEPLPVEHPFRSLGNVLISPHVAGMSRDSYRGLMTGMVSELERFAAGEPLRYQVTAEMLATMA